jgi:hypothetical protein
MDNWHLLIAGAFIGIGLVLLGGILAHLYIFGL